MSQPARVDGWRSEAEKLGTIARLCGDNSCHSIEHGPFMAQVMFRGEWWAVLVKKAVLGPAMQWRVEWELADVEDQVVAMRLIAMTKEERFRLESDLQTCVDEYVREVNSHDLTPWGGTPQGGAECP